MVCPECGAAAPDDARFCPSCGHALSARAGVDRRPEERRVVTVLFADVVGFSSLAEHADPERVKRLIDATFERLVADVERFGGSVDKLLGDGLLALFGAPVAHEDDAERAIRAALCMHDTLRSLMEAQQGEPGERPSVQLRIGINTGEVLIGTIAGTDYTAMGDVVNTASRLQALAPPGGVLVGNATRELCSDAVVFEQLEPAQLRGRDQVERVWLALGVELGARPRRWLSDASFVGRAVEVGVFELVAGSVARGRSAVVTVTGEAGIGKTRLVDEALASLRAAHPGTIVFEGACSPYGESDVWAPISTGIADHYGVERGMTADDVRRAMTARAQEQQRLDPSSPVIQREIEVLLHLLGHPSDLDRLDAAGARDLLFSVVIAGLRRRAHDAPVVVWIDDLQWAHALLVDLLQVMARSLVDLPLLLVVAFRPTDDLEWPPFVERSWSLHVPVEPLDERDSAALVAELTHGRASHELATRLYERSGGNPLFLTELARLAVSGELDDHAAAAEAPPDRPADTIDTVADDSLPGSLRALIAARLDQLGPGERAIVDNAAILGSEGKVGGLVEFAKAMGQDFDRAHLDSLASAGLLEVDGSRWRFRSDVVREVAYQTLTKQARAQRHAGVATVMAGFPNQPLDELAHHLATAAELAGELGPVPGVHSGIRAQAIDLLAQAAQRSYDMGGHRHGADLARRALSLAPDDPDARRSLLLLHATGLVEIRSLDAARTDLAEVLDSAGPAGDRVAEGEAHRLLGTVDQLDGDLVRARERLGRAVEIFRELDDRPRLAVALRARGFAEVFGGSLDDADWYLGEADGLYEELGDERGRAWVAQYRSWVSFLSGDHDEAHRRLESAIATFEHLGDHSGVTWTRGLLAYVLYFERHFDEAEVLAEEVLHEARRWGDEWGASMMLALSANLRLWTGRFTEAMQAAERSLAGFRRLGDLFGSLQAMAPLNRARVALGRQADAERGIEEVLAVAERFGGLAFPSIAASGVAMHLGDGARAVALASEAIERMGVTGASVDEAKVQQALGLLQMGRADDALAALLDVGVERSPFALAVRAAALAVSGDLSGALRDADAVDVFDRVSYFDRLLAAAAGAAAAVRAEGRDAAARVDRARSLAAASGDLVLGAFVRSLVRRLGSLGVVDVRGDEPATVAGGGPGTGGPPTGQLVTVGWGRLVEDLAGGGA